MPTLQERSFNLSSPDQRTQDDQTAKVLSMVGRSYSRALILSIICSGTTNQPLKDIHERLIASQGEPPSWDMSLYGLRHIMRTFEKEELVFNIIRKPERGGTISNYSLTPKGEKATQLAVLIADFCHREKINMRKLIGSRQGKSKESDASNSTATRLKILREIASTDTPLKLWEIASTLGVSPEVADATLLELWSAGLLKHDGSELNSYAAKDQMPDKKPSLYRHEKALTERILALFSPDGECVQGSWKIKDIAQKCHRDVNTVSQILVSLTDQGFIQRIANFNAEVSFEDDKQRANACEFLEIVDTYTTSEELQQKADNLINALLTNQDLAKEYMESSKPTTDTESLVRTILEEAPEGLTAREVWNKLREMGRNAAYGTVKEIISEIGKNLHPERRTGTYVLRPNEE